MQSTIPPQQCGVVYIVGAGPGDEGLITLRGTRCLARADVVLYDYLVNPDILRHAPSSAELVCLGRHGQGRILSQREIERRMIAAAKAGAVVVRLKGGDPSVFARIAEELDALVAENIPFEIVPGVTAAAAVGSHAGLPLTDRDAASCVAFVAGRQQAGASPSLQEIDALANFPGTVVFYMGVTTAPDWSASWLAAGRSSATPVAIIRRCTWPDQSTTRCTLGEVAQIIADQRIRPPALIVIGDVAGSPSSYDWFSKRPLYGQTVLVTRPRDQAGELRETLAELGARVLVQPAIETAPPTDFAPLDDAIRGLADYDWVVFASANGVAAFMDRLAKLRMDIRQLGSVRLAAIGPATARALAEFHLRVDVQPDAYRAEALAEALAPQAKGRQFLLIRASRGREVLAPMLADAGGSVDQVVAYQSLDVASPDKEIAAELAEGRIEWTTVTSSAIARSLVRMFGDSLRATKLASISPITSEVLRELGHPPAVEAAQYTSAGLVRALLER
jgi:uroporphyrinogen III methyltransferase/synthase